MSKQLFTQMVLVLAFVSAGAQAANRAAPGAISKPGGVGSKATKPADANTTIRDAQTKGANTNDSGDDSSGLKSSVPPAKVGGDNSDLPGAAAATPSVRQKSSGGATSTTGSHDTKVKLSTKKAAVVADPSKVEEDHSKSRAAAEPDDVTKQLSQMQKELGTVDPDKAKAALDRLDPKVVARAEKTNLINLDEAYRTASEGYNPANMFRNEKLKAYVGAWKKLEKIVSAKNLTEAQKKSLDTMILMELTRIVTKGENVSDNIAKMEKLLKEMKGSLGAKDPATRQEALDFLSGALAYYGKDGQLAVALEKWKNTEPSSKDNEKEAQEKAGARSGMAEMMKAMAKLQMENVAEQMAKGASWSAVDFDKAFAHIQDNIPDWVAHRLAQNGESIENLPAVMRDLLCKCTGHATACKLNLAI